jgi:hypothetical protein
MSHYRNSLEVSEHVKKNIKALCKKHKISFNEVNKAIGTGSGNPSVGYTLYKVIKYAAYFGMSLDDLVFKVYYE